MTNSRYFTIGHQVLDLEVELGANDSHKRTLDGLIDDAYARRLELGTLWERKKDAVKVLSAINDAIRSSGLNDGTIPGLFHATLEAKTIDCDDGSLIYRSVGEALRLPIEIVPAPNHHFVRFMFSNGDYINWETRSAEVRKDSYYKDWLKIPKPAIKSGVFLKNLTRDEIMSHAYGSRGLAWADKSNFDRAIRDYDEAIRLNPNKVSVYYNRGQAWRKQADALTVAVEWLNPNASPWMRTELDWKRTQSNLRRHNNLVRAIEDFNEVVRLNPNDADGHNCLGLAWAGYGDLDAAITCYSRAISLVPSNSRPYYNRGRAWGAKGNPDRAIRDYDEAIRLNPNNAEPCKKLRDECLAKRQVA